MTEIEKQAQCLKNWRDDPVLFDGSLFDNILWDKQREILLSVRDHKYTSAKSGNTVGKSYISALVALWFLLTHYPSKVITTAPTWTQVEDIFWKELGNLYNKSKVKIGGEILKTELKFNNEWFALGISTNEVNRFQGFHSPYLLVILDEALGVSPEIWEAISGLHPYRVLAIGNPLDPSGDFYNCFNSTLWNKITISCLDCVNWQDKNQRIPGLVTREWIEERKIEWGEGSPLYQSRVLGEFPEEEESALIKRIWVDRARQGLDLDDKPLDVENEEDSVRVTASDIATKHGTNETVIGYRYGHTVTEFKGYQKVSMTETRDKLAWMYSQKRADTVVVDADGCGEGMPELLAAKRIPVTDFHGGYGQKAMDYNTFKNLRSQFWWVVAKKFEKGLYNLKHIPAREYEILKNQLCCLKVKPPDAKGRIQVETKEDLQARSIKSPDYGDTFIMLEFGWYMSKYAEIVPYKYR